MGRQRWRVPQHRRHRLAWARVPHRVRRGDQRVLNGGLAGSVCGVCVISGVSIMITAPLTAPPSSAAAISAHSLAASRFPAACCITPFLSAHDGAFAAPFVRATFTRARALYGAASAYRCRIGVWWRKRRNGNKRQARRWHAWRGGGDSLSTVWRCQHNGMAPSRQKGR